MEVLQLPVWADNYAYLICSEKKAVLVDGPEAVPVERALGERGLELAAIWNTHHHFDHVGANRALLSTRKIPVLAGAVDERRVPGITRALEDGDRAGEGLPEGLSARVLFVPGHTKGHIAYYFAEEGALFCGDTLFAAGCGRLFEGTPEEMQLSLARLRSLPAETRVYCAHEYTLANLKFAAAVEPSNQALARRFAQARALRERGLPTVPSVIAEERATNPFLRWDSPEIIETAMERGGAKDADPVSVFAAIRKMKDDFS